MRKVVSDDACAGSAASLYCAVATTEAIAKPATIKIILFVVILLIILIFCFRATHAVTA